MAEEESSSNTKKRRRSVRPTSFTQFTDSSSGTLEPDTPSFRFSQNVDGLEEFSNDSSASSASESGPAPKKSRKKRSIMHAVWTTKIKSGKESPELQETAQEQESYFASIFDTLVADGKKDKRSDIERYLEDPCIKPRSDTKFDLMEWWRDVGSREYPSLAQVARLFLGIPSASSCVERLFNTGRDQIGVRRHRLSTESMEALMIVQHTLHRKRKKENDQ
jgi:hypothetical protein